MNSLESVFSLSGQTVAVIGAGSGIGAAVAAGCAASGARVWCSDIEPASADRVAGQIRGAGGDAEAAPLDIRDAAAVESALQRVCESDDRLDAVICTPGINIRKPLLDYTDDEFDRVVNVNLRGSLHVLQSAGRIMAARGRGSIVLYSSIRSVTVEPGQGVYAATKAGIVQLVRTLAAELGPRGVRVNAVAPGVVDTPLTQPIKADRRWYEAYASKSALGRWAQADELVGPTVFLASRASSYVTGSVLFVDGGWTATDGRFEPPGM